MRRLIVTVGWSLAVLVPVARGDESPLAQDWDYTKSMKKVADRFRGRPGVVLYIGDSITYSNPYGQWARAGKGKTAEDSAILPCMNTAAHNDTYGCCVARLDHPECGRSDAARTGL